VSIIMYFFQAEDGIRDFHVTGVQTCALPIYRMNTSMLLRAAALALIALASGANGVRAETDQLRIAQQFGIAYLPLIVASEKGLRSEERRVGQECNSPGLATQTRRNSVTAIVM